MKTSLPAALFASTLWMGFSTAVLSQEIADSIYLGGPILTMNDDAPRAEAVAVRDGFILGVGDLSLVEEFKGDSTNIVDLNGRTMLPGFVDSHGHVAAGGGLQATVASLLSPPDGDVTDIASLQKKLRDWADENPELVGIANLIMGFGYDPAQLAENRHPTREDLDAVSADIPVYVVHQSGHIGVGNSKALEVLGYDSQTENPEGGVIRRIEGSTEPDGVLEGNAHFGGLFKFASSFGDEGTLDMGRAGIDSWISYGFTTAQEGRADPATVQMLKTLADAGEIKIDIAIYPDLAIDRDIVLRHHSRDYENGIRIAGGKITIDGSPQGFTALRDKPYYDPVGDYEPGYSGIAYETPETINEMFDWAFENNIQMIAHANGEGASDILIAAVEQASDKHGMADRRPVLIHGQFLREDQVDSYQRLGVFPSLFPMHTFYWGDWHREHTVGPINGENISPTGWVRQRGMMFGTHHDAPVAFPDSMRVLDATVTRRTRSGDILGPSQRVGVTTALKAMTIWPAWQHFEEARKGSIEVGKIADFVILSDDPTAVDPETLDQLTVLSTIKDDEVIYKAPEGVKEGNLRTSPFISNPIVAHQFMHAIYQGMDVEQPWFPQILTRFR